ncbi:MAG: hypothetical protein F4099_01485 [Synechococcus sp. SB0673_bin_10]|nr:hypothetical protein [Synechococcus sp. SB0667_bin_8]MXY61873.1 hypothetical protein [Synechococcus sp. SB0665_bin_28]MYF20667.1 hypothetical protein [Synechococcus sp. SB0677_bin_5]MYG63768.1 hypothetical protein [Synechococcus sp. SB0675_bin_7]MYI71196.1 hypothetical protein [Synechococcus sp. SB0673_bin_10]MYK85609.1 hypothetical protein [Synechococcus sp. SB0669_bin_7]
MLIPLSGAERDQLLPRVATGPQFTACWGGPQVLLQRVMISVVGGVISLILGQTFLGFASPWGAFWLVTGIVLGLTWLWGPVAVAAQRNGRLRRFPHTALVIAQVGGLFTEERVAERREDVNATGRLELVESKRRWLNLELADEDGFLGILAFPLEQKHQGIRRGDAVCCLAMANRRDFSPVAAFSDAWLPQQNLWVGRYPYLRRDLLVNLYRRQAAAWG